MIYSTVGNNFNGNIFKGELNELEDYRKNVVPIIWEFCCDVYDGVNDFYIFKTNMEINHISWIYYKGNPNRIIKLAADEAEIKYCLTLRGYRGKGLYPATLARIQTYLKEKGYKRVFICVKEGNLPSIKGIEKAGFQLIAKVHIIKIMGIQFNKRYSFIKEK